MIGLGYQYHDPFADPATRPICDVCNKPVDLFEIVRGAKGIELICVCHGDTETAFVSFVTLARENGRCGSTIEFGRAFVKKKLPVEAKRLPSS
jgi:hypothetical protein